MTVAPDQVNQQNRIIYSAAFVVACAWLLMLFLSESFREQLRLWIPGGVKTAAVISILAVAIAAILLH